MFNSKLQFLWATTYKNFVVALLPWLVVIGVTGIIGESRGGDPFYKDGGEYYENPFNRGPASRLGVRVKKQSREERAAAAEKSKEQHLQYIRLVLDQEKAKKESVDFAEMARLAAIAEKFKKFEVKINDNLSYDVKASLKENGTLPDDVMGKLKDPANHQKGRQSKAKTATADAATSADGDSGTSSPRSTYFESYVWEFGAAAQ